MPDNPTRDALEELLDYFEQVETRTGALLLLLKDKGIIKSDEELKPYLDQASNGTDVIARAVHARFDFLFTKDDAKPATEGVPAPSATNTNVTQAAAQQPDQNSEGANRATEENAA